MTNDQQIGYSLANSAAIFVAALVICCAVLSASHAEQESVALEKLPLAASQRVSFVNDIRPLFEQHCYECHGPDSQEAGPRLDLRKAAMAGADSGPVILPSKSAESRLIHLVAGLDEEAGRMPPEGEGDALTSDQIALLRAWIDQGAEWPDPADGEPASGTGSDHWSFQPIVRPNLPMVEKQKWVRNDIDRFVLANLEQEKVAPSPEADRNTLLRRAYLDLVGLPPSRDELQTFLADDRPDAFERAVDRLLKSPHYGERWARHWLDVAHYADSDGYEKDTGRPFAWRFRDWVIRAINADLPFDIFTVQQLAGDLLKPTDAEFDPSAHVATGFLRNTLLNKEGGVDPEEDRVKRTIDRTNTLGVVWLGLSVGCANCHSHKYDPISQREYFGLYAFFNNLREVDPEVPSDKADATTTASKPVDPPEKTENKQLFQAIEEEDNLRETYVHLRGDFLSKGPTVEPHTPEIMLTLAARSSPPDRLDLARWLVSADHPLTSRVLVNRVWQLYFGRGLVSTVDDLGTQGEQPSHAQLLDWLASEFRSGGWRMKHLHRLIVTSATYRQSAVARPELADRDPYNRWLARQNRLRIEAELVRDMALAASGLLNPAIGGPSIRPPQPPGISDLTYANSAKWEESVGADRYRRGMYIWFQRTSPYPSLVGFDAPESSLACTRRERSNTPLQALTLLNDVVFVECAQHLGRRMMETPTDVADPSHATEMRIHSAFENALTRKPSTDELATLRQLYDDTCELCRANPTLAQKLISKTVEGAGPADGAVSGDQQLHAAACVAVARAIINLDEFITRE
jgi:mono/diheme cytochrome c family protein